MKFSLSKYNVIRVGQSEKRLQYDYHLVVNKLQEPMCEKDLEIDFVPNLLPEFHLRRTPKETTCLLPTIRTALKFMDKELFSKLFISNIRPYQNILLKCGN